MADGALLRLPMASGAWWSSAGPGASQGRVSPLTPQNPGERPCLPLTPPAALLTARRQRQRHAGVDSRLSLAVALPVPPGSANASLGEGRAQAGKASGTRLAAAASVRGHWCHRSCPCAMGEACCRAGMPAQCCHAADGTWRAPRSAHCPSGSMGAAAPGPALPEGGWEARGEVMVAALPGDTCGR